MGVTGLMATDSDISNLVDRCNSVLENPSLAKKLSHSAYHRTVEQYYAKSMARKYEESHNNLL